MEKKEVTDPTRIVTTTVRVSGGAETVVSVKTKEDIPKDQIFACIRAMKGITVPAPVHIGDVVLHDAAHTGVDVIATKMWRFRDIFFSFKIHRKTHVNSIDNFSRTYYH